MLIARIQQKGFKHRKIFAGKIISACAKAASLSMGVQVHSAVTKLGLDSSVFVCNALIDFYGKCNVVSSAHQLFYEIPDRNVITWNSLISAYLHADCVEIAIWVFLCMVKLGITPTQFSLSALLLGCSKSRSKRLGSQVHCLSLKTGLYFDVIVRTDLITTYSKCYSVDDSRKVFDEMPYRDIVTWTSMITAYSQNHKPQEAMLLFKEMQLLGFRSNQVIYTNLLFSFHNSTCLNHCNQMHCKIVQEGFESNEHIAVSLMTAYSVCGRSFQDFHLICWGIGRWDHITWNAAIAGFSNLGCEHEALKYCLKMRVSGIPMDDFTFTSTLKAIGKLSALEEGMHVHGLVFKVGYVKDLRVQSALISMYSRCGLINESKKVFYSFKEHNIISWSCLLYGCACNGYGTEAIELFEEMIKDGIKPDNTAFLVILSACNHVGLLEEGLKYFDLMRQNGSSGPTLEHYICVVDMYARAGYLREAEAFINTMPISPGPSVYRALLNACQVYGNTEIAVIAATKFMEMYPHDQSTYNLLYRIFAYGGHREEAMAYLPKTMYASGVKKVAASSWVSVPSETMVS